MKVLIVTQCVHQGAYQPAPSVTLLLSLHYDVENALLWSVLNKLQKEAIVLQKFENSAIWESHKIEENTKLNVDIGVIISLLNDSIAASIKGYEDTPPLNHTIGMFKCQEPLKTNTLWCQKIILINKIQYFPLYYIALLFPFTVHYMSTEEERENEK